jgi:hypothetical protein
MEERVRKPMKFRFFFLNECGREIHIALEFFDTQRAQAYTEMKFDGLTYLRHERLA